MNKTINYYNVGIYKEEIKTNIDFNDLLSEVNNLIWSKKEDTGDKRVRVVFNKVSTMFRSIYKEDAIIIPMGQFRMENKPFIAELKEDEYKEILSNIVEISTLVYFQNRNTAVLEYNQSGLKKIEVEEYFTSFLPENYYVKFAPVMYKQRREQIKRTNKITSIKIGINTSEYIQRKVEEHNKINNGNNKLIPDLLKNIKGLVSGIDSLNAEEVFIEYLTTGEKDTNTGEDKTMNIDLINQIIDLVDYENNPSISTLKLSFRDTKKEKMTSIDLKISEMNLKAKLNVGKDKPGPERLGDLIIENLPNHYGELNSSCDEFKKDINIFDIELPELYEYPRDEHKYIQVRSEE